jgi:hypothetical protein
MSGEGPATQGRRLEASPTEVARVALAWLVVMAAVTAGPEAHAAPDRDALAGRFAVDPEAQRLALSLLDVDGDDVDTLPAQPFDGGYRGQLQLVPALPVDELRQPLAWVHDAALDFDAFFARLARQGTPRYRWHGLSLHFFRTVGNTTPNAFAWGWNVAVNVHGSIDTTADATRETLFHEVFHLNDADHGDWSPAHLASIQDAIEHKCAAVTACLTPYAPTGTIVRRGTYAFQPGNDVHEYAAETALRYYRENRAISRGERPVRPAFKCGPDENRRAWEALRDEFFGGVDLVPSC